MKEAALMATVFGGNFPLKAIILKAETKEEFLMIHSSISA